MSKAWTLFIIGCTSNNPGSVPLGKDTTGEDTLATALTGETGTTPTDTGETGHTSNTGDTGDNTAVEVLAADCTLTDNALRVSCTATLSGEGTATVVLSAPGADTRAFTSDAAVEHVILGWGLLPETTYDWSIGEQTGTVTTGSLPTSLAGASIATTGTSWGFDAVLYPISCIGDDWFTLIDGSGRIVWYESNDVFFFGSMTGYEWSQPSRSVLSVNDNRFLEQHVSGEILLELTDTVDFDSDDRLHHDTERWGDYRYLLFEYPFSTSDLGILYVDGFHVFEGDTWLGTFDLADYFDIEPGNGDWAHTNGINVTETGEIILSLLEFSTVLGVDGDPTSPTFLDLLWIAAGSETSLPSPDYTAVLGSEEGFYHQHNASRVGDELWLFDNMSRPDSRAARYLLDEALGTITLDASWSFDETCANQGGSLPLEGGGVLATCANSDLVWAFQETSTTPDWTLTVDCGVSGGLDITRAIPVFIE